MKRILQIVDSMGMGGIQAFIMNVYRSIDKEEFQFDFLLHHKLPNSYDEEIKKLGGKIYYLPSRKYGILKNKKALDVFFKEHDEYKVVHQHESSLTYIEPLIAAKNNGVPIRIIHAHSTKASGNKIHTLLHYINKRRINDIATHYFTCGKLAGEWMYNNTPCATKFQIVNNGINIEQFKYNESIRKEYRKLFGVENNFVIGNVGRFSNVKNHLFLIDVFNEYLKIDSDSKLVLVGSGELLDKIKSKALELGIQKKILFLGVRKDVASIVQMFDFVIIPSLYEGFPVTAVEAQASGVPCIISDSVTKDVVINKNVQMLSLNLGAKKWASSVINQKDRETDVSELLNCGFDINTTLVFLKQIYEKG